MREFADIAMGGLLMIVVAGGITGPNDIASSAAKQNQGLVKVTDAGSVGGRDFAPSSCSPGQSSRSA